VFLGVSWKAKLELLAKETYSRREASVRITGSCRREWWDAKKATQTRAEQRHSRGFAAAAAQCEPSTSSDTCLALWSLPRCLGVCEAAESTCARSARRCSACHCVRPGPAVPSARCRSEISGTYAAHARALAHPQLTRGKRRARNEKNAAGMQRYTSTRGPWAGGPTYAPDPAGCHQRRPVAR